MRITNPLLAVLAAVIVGGVLPAQVVINEFSYDDSGTDDREFVELYNAGTTTVDLSGWQLECADTAWTAPFTGDNNADYTIPAGTMLMPGGFLVVGASTVPNVGVIIPAGVTGGTNLFENSNETITLRDAAGAYVDGVAYETNKGPLNASLYEGLGYFGNFVSVDNEETSISRKSDGFDTNENAADFITMPSTPGAPNAMPAIPGGLYCDDFEAGFAGSSSRAWFGSYVTPMVVDPTVGAAGTAVVNAVPASPDGGNALVLWDPSGGGNTCGARFESRVDSYFETYVYLDATEGQGDTQGWSIGLRGGAATFYNLPLVPAGTVAANADSGIQWRYSTEGAGGFSGVQGSMLELVDRGIGSTANERVIATIPITAGTNDGWQRIRLEVNGSVVFGNFGGTFGDPGSGQTFVDTTTTLFPGILYTGYRETVAGTTTAFPLMLDGFVYGDIGRTCTQTYQLNQANAVFTVDGLPGSRFAAAFTETFGNSFNLEFDNAGFTGLPWDVVIVPGDALPLGAPGTLQTPAGQIVNVNLFGATPPIFLTGGTALNLTTSIFPGATTLPVGGLPAGAVLSAQAVFFDPASADAISLSQPNVIQG